MTEQQEKRDNPVVSGLVALLAVGLSVGLVLAGVALVATRMLGLGDDGEASADGTGERESLYLPPPAKTTAAGPVVTLNTEAPGDETDDTDDEGRRGRRRRRREVGEGDQEAEDGDRAPGRPDRRRQLRADRPHRGLPRR
ncbi:hypothetical protein [Nocardioides sp. TF02-7]|uniref:hypothetical protein n=1 Tax=Nocardioides sp. TF02-7 TaxID=2917724 RepID=UPI001F062530|nr:hypothetical protein [Nocardioides sp. TF02-7]UMG94589.1 hypothetical protein MF408_11920 [Nocardioides sp. TF02-7]